MVVHNPRIKQLVFVDIETTARNDPKLRIDPIVEVAAAVVNLDTRAIEYEKDWLIRPDASDFNRNQAIHLEPPDDMRLVWDLGSFHTTQKKFRDVDWTQAHALRDVVHALRMSFFLPGATVAGQNPHFDLDHLKRDFNDLGYAWPKLDYHVFDLGSPAMFLAMSGITEGLSLRHTLKWAGGGTQKHRALADVHDAITVFWAMHDFFLLGKVPGQPVAGYSAPIYPAQETPSVDPLVLCRDIAAKDALDREDLSLRDKPTNPQGYRVNPNSLVAQGKDPNPRMTMIGGGYNHKIEKVCPVCGSGFGVPEHKIQEKMPPSLRFCDRSVAPMIQIDGPHSMHDDCPEPNLERYRQ